MQAGGTFVPAVTLTSLSAFPNGPFPHTTVTLGGGSPSAGRTMQPSVSGGLLAFGVAHDGGSPAKRIGLSTNLGVPGMIAATDEALRSPAVSTAAGVVVFERAAFGGGIEGGGQLVFRTLSSFAAGATTSLPAIVNAPGSFAFSPSFSADGRYLAFKRLTSSGLRLLVWDTQTQLLLDSEGLPIASPENVNSALVRAEGSTVITNEAVFVGSTVKKGNLNFQLVQSSVVGIIVQRVVGKTKVLGRSAPKLRFVGRVPFGAFRKGSKRHKVKWDFKVNGKRLPRGTYQVTLRSITKKGAVRDLAEPATVEIR